MPDSSYWLSEEYPQQQREFITSRRLTPRSVVSEKAHVGKALWDTGSTMSGLNERVVEQWGLSPDGEGICELQTYGKSVRKPTYYVDVCFPSMRDHDSPASRRSVKFSWCSVVAIPEETALDVDLIVGMDIIGLGTFMISEGRYFSFHFSPIKTGI